MFTIHIKQLLQPNRLFNGALALLFLIATILTLIPAQPAQAVNVPITIPDTPVADFPTTSGFAGAILPAPDGSVYVGGNFTEIGGVARSRLARILPDNTVDPNFDPDISGESWSNIYELALSPDGQTLYAGGTFDTVNGDIARGSLAAFNAETGVVTDFNPLGGGYVYAMTLSSDGNILYVGGDISKDGRSVLFALNTATGAIVPGFEPAIDSICVMNSSCTEALALSPDGQTLYAGGTFTTLTVPAKKI